jgi:ankyrin repeat protein
LLQNRADPSIKTGLEMTALELAVETRQLKIGEALLKARKSYPGIHRVLLQAIEKKMERLSYVLIKRDKELGSLDDKGRSALWHSASKGLLRTTENLLASKKIDLDQADVNGYSAVAQAIKNGHVKVTRLLVKWRADLTAQTNEGNTLLMLAVLSEKPEIVQLLLQRNIDVNVQDEVGETALMMAAGTGQDQVIEMLINAGADMQLRSKEELNAYQIAQNAGYPDAAEFIREKSNFVFKLFN